MNVHKWLKDNDPLAREQSPAAEDLDRMRRRVVAAAGTREVSVTWSLRIVWAGAIAAVALAVVVGLNRRSAPEPAEVVSGPRQVPATAVGDRNEPGQPDTRRQLHFATPGGTRIIWVFNSDFKL